LDKPAGQVRVAMIERVARTLGNCAERGMVTFPPAVGMQQSYAERVAGVVVDDLAAEALANLLRGMATGGQPT
jgi:hypothetical protein